MFTENWNKSVKKSQRDQQVTGNYPQDKLVYQLCVDKGNGRR